MILILLSISSVSSNSPTQFQQKYNGGRGQVNSVHYYQKVIMLCPLIKSGSNTAVILFGAGFCNRFFQWDMLL